MSHKGVYVVNVGLSGKSVNVCLENDRVIYTITLPVKWGNFCDCSICRSSLNGTSKRDVIGRCKYFFDNFDSIIYSLTTYSNFMVNFIQFLKCDIAPIFLCKFDHSVANQFEMTG